MKPEVAVDALIQVALESPVLQRYTEDIQRILDQTFKLLEGYPPEVMVYVGHTIAREGGYDMLHKAITCWEVASE